MSIWQLKFCVYSWSSLGPQRVKQHWADTFIHTDFIKMLFSRRVGWCKARNVAQGCLQWKWGLNPGHFNLESNPLATNKVLMEVSASSYVQQTLSKVSGSAPCSFSQSVSCLSGSWSAGMWKMEGGGSSVNKRFLVQVKYGMGGKPRFVETLTVNPSNHLVFHCCLINFLPGLPLSFIRRVGCLNYVVGLNMFNLLCRKVWPCFNTNWSMIAPYELDQPITTNETIRPTNHNPLPNMRRDEYNNGAGAAQRHFNNKDGSLI